jgi:hypothetical protein
MGAPSTYVKNSSLGQIKVDTGSGETLTVPFTLGDTKVGPLMEIQNEPKEYEARGRYVASGWGARVYAELAFGALIGNLIGPTLVPPGALLEILTRKGAYASATGTEGAGRPYTVKVTLTIEGTDVGDSADETVVLNHVKASAAYEENEDGNRIAVTGKVLGSIVITNAAGTATYQGLQ